MACRMIEWLAKVLSEEPLTEGYEDEAALMMQAPEIAKGSV